MVSPLGNRDLFQTVRYRTTCDRLPRMGCCRQRYRIFACSFLC